MERKTGLSIIKIAYKDVSNIKALRVTKIFYIKLILFQLSLSCLKLNMMVLLTLHKNERSSSSEDIYSQVEKFSTSLYEHYNHLLPASQEV